MKRWFDWGILALFVALACAVARGQVLTPNKETTRTFDGCNWTTCEKGLTGCTTTLVGCVGSEDAPKPQTLEFKIESIPAPAGHEYDIGTRTLRFTDENLRAIYHEKFEYIDGKLRILKPIWIECVSYCTLDHDVSSKGIKQFTVLDKGQAGVVFNAKPEPSPQDQLHIVNDDPLYRWKATIAKPAPQAEGEPGKSVCGTNIKDHTENITLLQIPCVDYDELRKVAPNVPWPTGTRTQVLVHVREGYGVEVSFGGEYRYTRLTPHADGQPHGMVQFEGTGFTTLPEIRVLAVR